MAPDQTVGEQRGRITFNPAASSDVDVIKNKSAELIDLCEKLKTKDLRLASLAQTSYEEAAMWAVRLQLPSLCTKPVYRRTGKAKVRVANVTNFESTGLLRWIRPFFILRRYSVK